MLLGCLRKTFSRVLVLIVSMGFGVVLPYLGAIQKKARHLPATCATAWWRGPVKLQHRKSFHEGQPPAVAC